MKFIFKAHLLLAFGVFFNSIDLNSSMNNYDNNAPQVRQDPQLLQRVHIYQVDNLHNLMPDVRFFIDPLGYLTPINRGQGLLIRELAFLDDFIIGVVINGGIYPIFNWMRNQVLVRISNGKNVRMTISLRAQYGQYFALRLDQQATPHRNQRRRLNPTESD